MDVIYCALELESNDTIDATEIARLANLKLEDVVIKNLSECTAGNHKRFAIIADLYIWTSKLWYGTFREILTFIEMRGIKEIPPLITLKYSDKIRLAIASKRLSIFDKNGMMKLRLAERASIKFFNEERISKLKPLMPNVEEYYSLLYVRDNFFK
jgi:hypothetical protein